VGGGTWGEGEAFWGADLRGAEWLFWGLCVSENCMWEVDTLSTCVQMLAWKFIMHIRACVWVDEMP
jgi:hypothetical protein